MRACHKCKKELGRQHIVYHDFESNRQYHLHEACASEIKEAVLNEFFNLMFRVAYHTLQGEKK